ncbi:MAG: hypothetical protein ABFS56_32070 [Pseudomonadota bacterium]
MGKIILDDYLTRRGLTEESCRVGLNISEHDLGEHTLTIKLVKKIKKRGPFWSIQLFLDDERKGVSVGGRSASEQAFPRSAWERDQNFL